MSSFQGRPNATAGGLGIANFAKANFLTYSELQHDLLTSGQRNFFTFANLPEGDSLNGISNFWVSSSVAAAFGLPAANNQPDGDIVVAKGSSRAV